MKVRAVVGVLLGLLLAAGCSEDPGRAETRRVIRDLATQEYGRATSRYRQHEEAVLSPSAAPLWREAIDHDDSTVREWAVDALSRIGLEQDIDRVVARLEDPVRGVRRRAAEGLVGMAPSRAREEFFARLEGDTPAQVVLAAEGLALLQAEGAAERIASRLSDPALPAASRAALTQPLATLGDPAAAVPLADIAVDPEADTQLRRLAGEALVVLDGAGVREQVERLLQADDEYVTTLAREYLAQAD